MVGLSKRILVALSLLAAWPQMAAAGGSEFPADGTRGLGRGGTGMTRADDPTVMLRNPALLADLWDDQAMLQSHLLLQDACFNPYGPYGWDLVPSTSTDEQTFQEAVAAGRPLTLPGDPTNPQVSVLDLGDGVRVIQDQASPITDVRTGQPVQGSFENERFAEVCFEGPNTFLPSVAVAVKLAEEFGLGLGFFTPETLQTPQFGNPDGTVDTPNGRRPAETRYFLANRNVSYLSFLGAFGWRPTSWLRVGAGFQWTLLAFNTTSFARVDNSRDPSQDLRTDVFGRDLFIPGVIGSIHVVPADWLDMAVGFKWSDNIRAKSKLDLTLNPWGIDQPFQFEQDGTAYRLDKTPSPLTTHNQPGVVDAPPIWAPQLSVGLRISDRLKPRPVDWAAAHEAAGRTVEDHMSSERWDLEFNGVVYFNSVRDYTDFETSTGELELGTLEKNGNRSSGTVTIGDCTVDLLPDGTCPTTLRSRRELGGQMQYSFRVGGDYNVLPGLFALRLGGSYETRGVNPDFFDPTNYDMTKIGLHAGFTVRLAERTDISFAYALFLMEDMNLRIPEPSDEEGVARLMQKWRAMPGYGYTYVTDPNTGDSVQVGDFNGVGRFEVPRTRRSVRGPHFANPGTAFYNLSVLSASITQHF